MSRFRFEVLILVALVAPAGVAAQTNPSNPPDDKAASAPKQPARKGRKAVPAPVAAPPASAQSPVPDAEVNKATGEQNPVPSAPASSGTKEVALPKQKLRKGISPGAATVATSPASVSAADPEVQKKERDKAERARLARDQAWDAKMKKLLGGVCSGC